MEVVEEEEVEEVEEESTKGWFGRECGNAMAHSGLPARLYAKKVTYFLVDCAVTGSDEGTSDNPKFSLKQLFET
eukprot:CAMPEP_0196801182 /NCGR_PEP_ID=MMETSP1362-20130617/889_1 /TAXON_ID=163516 /ORGANISM="Leptocylindrus danicus, Strain CCMP1856" /LENGTH=73 /DNA_ID=CAMNT_0042171983 /DNA_START=550 /DNA_END=768 /DNA_ORIENTATION=-